MRSVADELRRQAPRPPQDGAEERLVEALRLADSDLALRMGATGESASTARRALRDHALGGRRRSRCAER